MVRTRKKMKGIFIRKSNVYFLGIDALYNHLWMRPSVSTIRWLYLLVALGAILSTLMLLPSTISSDNNISLTTNITRMC